MLRAQTRDAARLRSVHCLSLQVLKVPTLRILIQFIDLLLYSNFFIAVAAFSLVWQSEIIIESTHPNHPSKYAWLVLSASLFVYAMHRIIGFTNIEKVIENRRIQIIRKFDRHIRIYAAISLIGLLYFALHMPFHILLYLIPPTLLVGAYITPLYRGMRFRDMPFVKVFLVGFVWSWVCVFIPFQLHGFDAFSWSMSIMAFEKFLFITAITIPFDVRDLAVDGLYNIKTIPSSLGVKKSILISNTMLMLAALMVVLAWSMQFLDSQVALGLLAMYALTVVCVSLAHEKRHDYYFSIILDGTIIAQSATVWCLTTLYGGTT